MSPQRAAYTLLAYALLPFALLRLWWRGRKLAAYRHNLGERFGYPSAADAARAPDAALVWIHAVSVGETRAVAPLVETLLARDPRLSVLLTHMTPTGRATAQELFRAHGERVRSRYLPYDLPPAIARFLRHYRPRCAILVETELWPNLLAGCQLQGVAIALINARLSARSARGYARVRSLAAETLARLDVLACQTPEDGQRLQALGACPSVVTGNLKFDLRPPADLLAQGESWHREGIGARPCLLAASTREGEEAPLFAAFARLAPPEVLLIVVPRHPQRFDEVAASADRAGLALARRSSTPFPLPSETRVWLGDSMGEMFAYYACADVALIGGSWAPFGGQNLIEACACGCPAILGPHTWNFAYASSAAEQAGAAFRASDLEAGVTQALALLADPDALQASRQAGIAFASAHRGASARTLEILEHLLPQL